jgi:hypothetical protein
VLTGEVGEQAILCHWGPGLEKPECVGAYLLACANF